MRHFTYILFLLSIGLSFGAETKALKLWPQLTPGICNHANVLAMKSIVADDGLTVTDEAWESYQVEGCAKRWT